MGSGMSKVVKGLYLGNIRDSEDRENLLRNGVTHILSVHNRAKPVLEDMTYLCISASDSSSQNLLQHFKECIKFIHECRLGGGGCLVHCLAGVSRSTTILVAYLMTVTEFGWEACLAATKAVRSYVSPNFGFQQQLQEYEATLLQELPLGCPPVFHARPALGSTVKDRDPKPPWEDTRTAAGPLPGKSNPQRDVHEASRTSHHPRTWSRPWR
ncbi:dual specificity protein phosphatase 22-A-like isoform X3 [Rissa tridactyla]|uniref:dual specificity protein phosphatase 22-A-like isoform X3 n=1 Tax=Rissa tridactyla TaxID=75485 RepID=UPI0023BB011F|nr:dual specificity protein phosphatase 22-A-like isoform X3 [Rissa tridactyla]